MKRVISIASSGALLLSTLLAMNVLAAGSHRHAAKKMITVQLCSSTPYGVPALQQLSQGIRNGVSLAEHNMKAKLKSVGVKLIAANQMDDAKSDGSGYSTDKEHANALKCLGMSHTLGYVGTLNSGAALVSEPVLNKGHMVMVSPANTNPGLTSVKPVNGTGGRASQEPATFKGQVPWVTYYRTVTTDALQGPAGALFAQKTLHAKTYFLVDDKQTYGAGLAATFKAEAQRLGMKELGSGHVDSSSSAAEAQTAQSIASNIESKRPDMVYCGCDSETTLALPRNLRAAGFTNPYMGGDAIFNSAWIKDTGRGSVNNYATSVGPDVAKTAAFFKKLYKKVFPSFYANPGPQAYDAPSYDAAGVILTAIYEAAKAGQLKGNLTQMRTAVVKYVHNIRFKGATGVTRFDKNGDTTNRILSVYAVDKGNWVFKGQLKPKGFKPTG